MKLFWFFQSSADQPGADTGGTARWVIWTTLLALAVFGWWANWAELDQVTRAPGSVIASSRTQVIQSQDGGTVEAMLVKEGDVVEAGQLLVKLDRTKAETAYLEARAKAAGLGAAVARLHAEIGDRDPVFKPELKYYPEFRENQLLLLRKRRSAISEEISALQGMLVYAQKELDITQPLLKSGDVSQTDVLRLQRQVADLKAQISNKRNKYLQDTQAELAKAEEDLAGVSQNLAQRKAALEQTSLNAPLKGVVKNVRITTIGGVLRPGDEVMQIVPLEDDLVIEARVKPADIAFLKPGLAASVKIDAYDYTIYGDLSGKLTYISADTLSENLRQGEEPYYRVQVRTEGRRFSARPDADIGIQPGMTATVEIKTGQRTVLQYLTKPITKTLSESLGER
ncbi:MAG: Type secretion system rane fusion protein PrsE [Pseudomonadota bacterium]|jgi:adhesin transport system membrane fusion protein